MKTMAEVALSVFNDWWQVGSNAREGIKDDSKNSNQNDSQNVGGGCQDDSRTGNKAGLEDF